MKSRIETTRLAGLALSGALAALAGAALLPGEAAAQSDVRVAPPPIVMVLLDTSGSMEFERSTGEYPTCYDPNIHNFQPPGTLLWAKPRHVIAKEVLTGRFAGYYCEEVDRRQPPSFDNTYPVPHFEPRYARQLRETGLVHLNQDLVRFGFMAFDSDPDGLGNQSYPNPPEAPESLLWNLGALGPNAQRAPLIPVGDLTRPDVARQNAKAIEDAIVNFIPFGSTPLAALFHDLDTYLAKDTDVQNDAFKACRNRDIIVITDGQPSFDDCAAGEENALTPRCAAYPYKTTLKEMAELVVNHGVRIHVIGFDLSEEDKKPCRGASSITGAPANVACIHQMAFVGGTDSNADPNDNVYAYVANNQVELTREITKIINRVLDGTTARTKTTTTRRTAFRDASAGSYQFSAAFELDPAEHLWRGRLERVERKCVGGALQVSDALNFGDTLDARAPSSRLIFSALLDPARSNRVFDEALVRENSDPLININRPRTTLGNLLAVSSIDQLFDAGALPGTSFENIRAMLSGGDVRAGRALGDIFHSNPVVVGGPELSINIPGYQRFANSVNPFDNPRKTMIYVGANDGLLHAFNAESTAGDELWSFLPIDLQRRIYLQKATHIFGVDGSPQVRDVRLFRGPEKPADVVDPVGDAEKDPSGFFDIWDTVLLGNLRAGGQAHFALSVADPTKPRFLWELNPDAERRRLQVAGATDPFRSVAVDLSPNAPLIGLSYGDAGMGVVTLEDQDGNRFERGVAIIPGGLPNDTANPGRIGRVLFVVDLATGQIMRRFTTFNNNSGTPIDAPISGAVAVHDDFPGKIMSRAFVGDAKGRLLRVDLRSTNPANWTVSVFHDSQTNQPIFLRPAIAPDRQGRLVALYGTGDIDDIENRRGGNVIFSVTEVINFVPGEFNVDSFTALLNWKIPFTGAEKLTGAPIIFSSVAYFPTFVPNSTACSLGHGRVYAVDFNRTDENGNIIGKFDNNDSQFDNQQNGNLGLELSTSSAFFDLPDGTVVFGLEIAGNPACTPDVPDNLNNESQIQKFNPSSNQDLDLVIQTGGKAVGGSKFGASSKINTLRFKLKTPPSAIFPRSWSAVLD